MKIQIGKKKNTTFFFLKSSTSVIILNINYPMKFSPLLWLMSTQHQLNLKFCNKSLWEMTFFFFFFPERKKKLGRTGHNSFQHRLLSFSKWSLKVETDKWMKLFHKIVSWKERQFDSSVKWFFFFFYFFWIIKCFFFKSK